MNQIDIHKRKTDQAWNQLYSRLEKEDLLPNDISHKPSGSIRIQTVKWAAAIAILCVSAVMFFTMNRQNANQTPLLSVQNNENAATLITTLEDGSVVYLSDKACIQFPEHFQTDKREVILDGDALFDVSGNKERPFYIETEEVQIEVIGTSFHVKSSKNTPFELSVKRGEVRVFTKSNKQSTRVKAGETAILLPKGLQVQINDDIENSSRLSQRILFKDEKLGDILRILNQEFSDKIIRTTPSLENKRINIGFENNTANEMAEVLCQGFNLTYTEKENVLLISEP